MKQYLSKWFRGARSHEKLLTRRPHVIFINHRGVDTKHTIAGLLYDRLSHLKLNPFLDSKSMMPGDELLKNIENGIRECKVGVAIFSPTYCHSYYCLHELAIMSEYHKKIIPIFYDVSPSDLVISDDGAYSANDLDRYRWALELAKGRVGLSFDSRNGDWPGLLDKVSDSIMKSLAKMEAEEKIMAGS